MLDRIFIKNYEDKSDSKVRNAYGVLASIVGIVFNIILSVAKMAIGALFHSVAILADGVNNLSDAGSSLVTLFGFKIAGKPADTDHPFGHARVEYVTSMIVAFVVLFLGLELAIGSIKTLISGEAMVATIAMMVVLGVSIVVKLGLFFYYRNMAKKIDSGVFKATSVDCISDSVSTLAVLISTIITYFTGVNLDGYMGMIVAIIILIGGAKLFKETLSPLLGEKPPKEFVKYVSDKIKSYDGVYGIHDLVVHNYGPNVYHASVHVEVDASKDILVSHEMIDEIERAFKEEGVFIVIHLDPIIVNDERVDRLKDMIADVLDEIDESITFHDFRVVWGENRKNVIFDIVLPMEYARSDEEIVTDLASRVRAIDDSITLVVDVDRNYVGI